MGEKLPKKPSYLIDSQKIKNNSSSLDKLQEHFIHLYGRRNNIYLPGRAIRIELFHLGVVDLIESVRKKADKETVEIMFARVVSRIFCIAHGINNVSIAEGMQRKYPSVGCSYCHRLPCQCKERRLEADLGWKTDISQSRWSLTNWQTHLRKLYREKNRQKGLGYTLIRLSGEVGEFISLEHEVLNKTIDKIELGYQLELADSLAWTIALANLLPVDLLKATTNRYGDGCRVCRKNPCNCKAVSFRQIISF